MKNLDQVQINFNDNAQWILQVILGLITLGLALDMKPKDFKAVWGMPRSVLAGVLGQFVLFPALTFAMVSLCSYWPATTLHPSLALGMFLVAACPGGNVSNFLTHLSKSNTALSVTLTAISTAAAVVMTPFNFGFWSSLYPPTAERLQSIELPLADMFRSVFLLLGLPVLLGMLLAARFPNFAQRAQGPVKIASLLFFGILVLGALAANWQHFWDFIGYIALLVALHNALALGIGWGIGYVLGAPALDRRTISIEVGIQNSGLGLVLFLQFFPQYGGIGIITAWWGIWHIVSGLTLALYWRNHPA